MKYYTTLLKYYTFENNTTDFMSTMQCYAIHIPNKYRFGIIEREIKLLLDSLSVCCLVQLSLAQ